MLTVSSLSKSFGGFDAVSDMSFAAREGEVLGFLGPNGAGKSTTMKMITGFLAPSAGEAEVMGYSIRQQTAKAQSHLGYMPENAPLYDDLTVEEFLQFVGQMRHIQETQLLERINTVIAMCSLREVRHRMIDTLSKGYRRRVSLAQALIHDPEVLILDEPTDGLDPNQKHDARTLIRQLAQTKCVLVSTHILEEVEEICHRIVIIGNGRKLYEGSPADLAAKSSNGRIKDVFRALTTGARVEGVTL